METKSASTLFRSDTYGSAGLNPASCKAHRRSLLLASVSCIERKQMHPHNVFASLKWIPQLKVEAGVLVAKKQASTLFAWCNGCVFDSFVIFLDRLAQTSTGVSCLRTSDQSMVFLQA
ncbi:hypothetical protein GOP47_0029020 [Adiantum capillus-veneris]|nr:hypothetical protein GOP47_0029020 [Adiantum capillus-veneris]